MDEEQLKQKEQEELRALLDSPDEEDSSGEDKKNKDVTPPADNPDGKETKPEAGKDDKPNEEGSEDEKNKDSKDKDKDKDKDSKDRWNGKSREEVIKEYETLESRVDALENKGPDEKDQSEDGKTKDKDEENLNLPSADELQKMTPSDFAKWVISRIDDGVKKTIETQEKIRESVRKEIAEAKKEHPLQDPDYRKMVQTIMDAASAKGTTVTLKEACVQVDAFLGKHKEKDEAENNDGSEELSDEEKSRLKKAKAQVESGAGAPTQPDGSDAETKRIQKALAGSGSKSPLGGLGI